MPTISPSMVGLYLILFWVQCVVGIGINAYNLALQSADSDLADIILQAIVGSEEVGIGAATNSAVIVITAEGIMVLAAWVKKRQLKEGIEIGLEQGKQQGIAIGKEQGAAEERKRTNAKLRSWAEEKGIPIEELPKIEDEDE